MTRSEWREISKRVLDSLDDWRRDEYPNTVIGHSATLRMFKQLRRILRSEGDYHTSRRFAVWKEGWATKCGFLNLRF